ncbi:MAG: heme-binding domain-containing protein [Bacteroidota bacterium]
MMKKKVVRYILIGLVAVLVIIQFFGIDKSQPTIDPSKDLIAVESPPAEVATILKSACYDCHSNETSFPWYTNIAPVSWWIKGHIDHGSEHLNFSVWGDYKVKRKNHKMEEIAEEVEEKKMPLKSYTWMHPEAKLSADDRKLLEDWAKSKMGE